MDKELIPSSNQNPITGDHMITKASNETYRNGWDRIFGEKKAQKEPNTDLNVGSSDLNVGSKEASPDVQEQSNQTCEDSPQQTEAEDLCNESSAAVRSGLLNRN